MQNKISLPKSLLSIIIVLVLLLGTSHVMAAPLADDDVVIIVKSGVNTDGSYRYEVADSGDTRAAQIWEISQNEASMRKVADYYSDLQQTENSSLSANEQDLLNFYGNTDKDPVYIEIIEGSNGAYCDWKADFTLKTPDGAVTRCITPKVVLNRNDPLFTGTDRGLQTQTLVHEIGHGAMSKLYGYDSLPYTEWLHKSHSGGTISDEKLAIIEGWAEFTGAYFTGDHTIANDPDNSMSDNRYAYKDIYTQTEVRSASDLKKTEGWVASTLLALVESGVVSISDLNEAMSNGTPHTFDALTSEIIKVRPEKADSIKTTIAEASMGKLYSEYYTTVSDYTANTSGNDTSDSDASNSYMDTTFIPNDANYPDFSVNQNEAQSKNKKLFAVITGALLGALAGSPFGIVGIAVGAVAGLVIGNFIGDNLTTESYVPTPAMTGTSAPQVTGGDALNEQPKATNAASSNLTELRANTDNAFTLYLKSVQHGTIDEQKSSLENYRAIHRQYRNMLMKEETSNQ